MALARQGSEIWVALRPPQPSTQPGTLRRLDEATLAPLGDVPTGSDPGALLALPERGSVLASNFESNTVTEHDAAGSASAVVELPIPPSLRASYPLGTKIHCYAYDSTTAAWEDFVEGTVQISSVDHTSPVLSACVRHFSWYGGDPQGQNCIDVWVNVVSAVDGKPLGNARVEATPGMTAYTDADGRAQVIAATGSSSYTAYQTGFDVDGSLTGIKGAKYIEFGVVEEEIGLEGLTKRSCIGTAAPLAPPTRTADVIGTGNNPLVIKVGAQGRHLRGDGDTLRGRGLERVRVGHPHRGTSRAGRKTGQPAARDGCEDHPDRRQRTIDPARRARGREWTLRDQRRSLHHTGQVVHAVHRRRRKRQRRRGGNDRGRRRSRLDQPDRRRGRGCRRLEASWSDTGTAMANPAYAPVYVAVMQGSSDTAYYLGTDRRFLVVKAFSNDPLSPGTYTATLLAFSGFYAQAGGGVRIARNISGAGVTGTFLSLGAAPDPITFTVH